MTPVLFLSECLVSFGRCGDVVMFDVEDNHTITVLVIRHQLEVESY